MVSDKEIEAALSGWHRALIDAHDEPVDERRRRCIRAALSAAARVRAEDNAEPVAWRYRYTDPVSGKPVWRYDNHLWNGQRPSERQALFARPVPQPSGTVEVADDMANAALKRSMDKHLSLLTNTEAMREIIKAALTVGKPQPSGWQPIETAPADGRVILVYEARSAHPIHLRFADGNWWRKQGVGPSHWMPLPTPPTAGGGDD